MEIIQKSAWVACPPEKVYKLVADIESYPEFLPWCSAAKILGEFDSNVEASLTLSKGGVSKSFSTYNTITPFKHIEITLLSGPFKHLEGMWTFEKEGEGTRVSLHLEFSFENKLMSMMLGPIFHPIANTLLDAFVKRAEATVCCTAN